MRRREILRVLGLAGAGWSCGSLITSTARAHPVSIGRYTEIPYGIHPAHPHPTAGGGPRRTGRVAGRAPAGQPTLVWERSLAHRRPRGPAIAATGVMYIGSMGGLTSLAPDGTVRWTSSVGAVHGAPSLTPSDDVVVVTRGGRIARISPGGVVLRSADLGAPARGSPLVLDDGSVLIGTINQRVHRLDANLRRVFSTELAEGVANTITRARRGVVAVTAGRRLTLLNVRGTLLRQVALGGRASAAAAVADDGTLLVTTVDGVLLAIDPAGRVRTRTSLGSRQYDSASLAVGHDGAVRIPTLSGGLICVGPGGTQRWVVADRAGFNAAASIDDGDTTLVIDRGGRLLAIEVDGRERWRLVLGTYSFQAPVLGADGTIYVSTERGAVQAWR